MTVVTVVVVALTVVVLPLTAATPIWLISN